MHLTTVELVVDLGIVLVIKRFSSLWSGLWTLRTYNGASISHVCLLLQDLTRIPRRVQNSMYISTR